MLQLQERPLYADPTPAKPNDKRTLPETYSKGRRCTEHGCSAFLSTYNPHERCWHHPRSLAEAAEELDLDD
jgi:hypothetical protein